MKAYCVTFCSLTLVNLKIKPQCSLQQQLTAFSLSPRGLCLKLPLLRASSPWVSPALDKQDFQTHTHTHTVFARSSCAPIKPRDLPLLILRQPRQQVLTERRSRKPSSCCHFVPLAEKSQDCHLGRSAVSSLQNIHRLFSDFPSRTPTPPTSWHHCVHFVIKEIKTSAGLTKCSRSLSPLRTRIIHANIY